MSENNQLLTEENNIMSEKVRVLYIDDEKHNLIAFKASFRRDFYVQTAESSEEGREILKNETFDVIVTDQRMPSETGVEFLVSILNVYPDPIRILLTGYTDIEAIVDAINKGQVYQYVTKPWDYEKLKELLLRAAELSRLRVQNRQLLKDLKKANEQLEFLLRQKLLD